MGQLLDLFVQWAKQGRRWPLLLLLSSTAAFKLVQEYFSLTFQETVTHGAFWIIVGIIFLVSGGLYWAILPRPNIRVLLGLTLAIFGAVFLTAGLWRLKPASLPEDRLVVAVAKFTPISPAAVDEASNLPHRIAQMLQDNEHNGVPLTTKLLSVEITGSDEEARREAARKLARSRTGSAHVILWGEVRKDEGELYVRFSLTVGRPLHGIRAEERSGESVVTDASHLEFKQHLSNDIADLVTVVYGLAYYKAGDWDRAIEILGHSHSDEGSLYRAISRIRRYIRHFRATFDSEAFLPELQQANGELSIGFNGFMQRGNLESAAVCLINTGHIQRLQNRWAQAVDIYTQAGRLSLQANAPGPEGDALIGLAKTEMLGLRSYVNAEAHADQAIVLGSKTDDKDRLFEALDLKAEAQEKRGDLIGATETLKRAFGVAEKLTEKTSLFYLYVDRADVYQKMAEECPSGGPLDACYRQLDAARADYAQALNLGKKLQYTGLTTAIEGFLKQVESTRTILDSRRKSSQARE